MNDFSDCYFCPDSKCFYHVTYPEDKKTNIKKKKMTGLTKVLKDVFYPEYEMVKPKDKVYSETFKQKASNNPNNLGLQLGPRVRGEIVHDQIRMLCDENLTPEFAKKYASVDPWTKLAVSWMKVRKFEPVSNELAIADPSLGIATAIDAIVYDVENETYHMVEWKTGSLDYFYYSTNKPCRYISNLDNSLYNQARLQILITNFILKKNYSRSGISIGNLFIIHVGDDGLHEHCISKEFRSIEAEVYKKIVDNRKK